MLHNFLNMRVIKMKNEKGFSLVELLVAVVMLAVGLLAVAGMQSLAINKNAYANRYSTATALAQEVMEDFLAREPSSAIFQSDAGLGPPDPSAANYDLDPSAVVTSNSVTVTGSGTFTVLYSIDANNPVTNVAKITVKVETTIGGGQTVTLISYKRSL